MGFVDKGRRKWYLDKSKKTHLHIYAYAPRLTVPSLAPPASPIRTSRLRSRLPVILAAIFILGLFLWKPPFVIRPLPSTGANSESTTITPALSGAAAYVDPIWDSKIVPAFLEKAIDAKELLLAIQDNPEQAGAKYGRREATNPYNYLIKGTGQVTTVNTESRAGTLTVALANGGGGQNVTIQIGPVILGTAIRDATGIVSFNQFTNQIDYAGVSKEMNARALHDALTGKDLASFNGKQIRFVGAITYDPRAAGIIRITPIRLEVLN
jgi:predicted lipoprotein